MPPRVAIIGAGIGGLAAAHHLSRKAAEEGRPIEVVVVEASDQPGGWLATESCEGALLERGPDTMVTHKPAGLALCRRLGLGERLVFKPAGRIDVLDGGRLLPLPAGFALAAPTRARPLLSSPLLSWRGKLRALAEPWVKPRVSEGASGRGGEGGEPEDESVASWVRRRFGEELYRRICEPVVGGLFMADTEDLSLAASFPRLVHHERRRERPHESPSGRPAASNPAEGARKGPPPAAATLDGGLGQIVSALVARLPEGALRLGCRVERLARGEGSFLLATSGGPLAVDAVLIALPAPAAAALLAELDPPLAGEVGQIAYASAATVHVAWPRRAVERYPPCHGFFVPRTARTPVVAASFVSLKYPERVPEDLVVVRVFLGGALHPETIGLPDAELVERSTSLLAPLLGIRQPRQPPTWSRVWRHPAAMPQRRVGHPALAARIRARLAGHPGLEFAGGPLGAYGLPDSIAEGEAAAERLARWVESSA